MRIVKFKGGLGNQMFQYSFLLALQHQYPDEEFVLDISAYESEIMHNGFELTKRFNIKNRLAQSSELSIYRLALNKSLLNRIRLKIFGPPASIFLEKDFSVFCADALSSNCSYYDGYWQSHQYFDDIGDDVKKAFTFIEELDSKNRSLYNEMLDNPYSVSLHIRRGDYLNQPLYRDLCNIDYYKEAINYVNALTGSSYKSYYIFSNDIKWCRDNLTELFKGDVTFIGHNHGADSYKDMILMSSCRYNILANSSFSWWAAYLKKKQEGAVIAPLKWINKELNFKIQLDKWVLL